MGAGIGSRLPQNTTMTRLFRRFALVLLAFVFAFNPTIASAQTEGWQIDLAPLYLEAATTAGNLAINGTHNIPVYLDFANAKDHLGGAFTFHGEVRRGQWGFLGDVFFIRLTTDVNYTTPILNVPLAGTLKLDQTVFNGKVTYEVKPGSHFHLVGGIRTVTISPSAHFTGPVGGLLADINISQTVPAAVGGFIYRPKLAEKVVLLTQADIGGGGAFTWSAVGGVEFHIKRWVGLAAGYSAMRIDTGSVPTTGLAPINDVEAAFTQSGPAFTLAFHWTEK